MKNRRIKLILDEVKDTDSVLDVGCASRDSAKGSVWIHRLLCQKARRVVGVDKILPEMGYNNYNIVMADAESMRLNERFDLIIAGELIEHLSNPGLFLKRAREHLKEGGRLILTVPNPWDWTRLVRAVLRLPSVPVHEHVGWYDEWTITNLAERYGFKVERVEFVPRLPYSGSKGFLATVVERIAVYISRLLYLCGLRQIAGMMLFIKCSLNQSERQG